MSIQDESFPHDELFEMDLSPAPLNRFQFPHRLRARQQQELPDGERNKNALKLVHNLSISNSSADQTISSAESATEQHVAPATAANERMIKSDQTGACSAGDARTQLPAHERKSQSYHDMHSRYTRRRYKHVESKVAQYIANIRDEDERRRKQAKFQRQSSLPELLMHGSQAPKMIGLQRSDTFAAERLSQALVGVIDAVEEEAEDDEVDEGANVSSGNVTALTSVTGSGSGATGVEADESVGGAKDDFIDGNMLALLLDERDRLKSYNDYQQLKLDEKQSELVRLRRNVDFLRVQLSTTENQLKKTQSGRYALNGNTSGCIGYAQTGRQSLRGFLYCATKSSKATQTEREELDSPPSPPPPPPSPHSPSPLNADQPHDELHLFVTPDTPDTNTNNQCSSGEATKNGGIQNNKKVAVIQPKSLNFSSYTEDSAERGTSKGNAALRRRSNSLKARQKRINPTDINGSDKSHHQNSRTSHPSSNDSAIDVEVIELSSSPKPAGHKRYTNASGECGAYVKKVRSLQYSRGQHSPSPGDLYIESCPNSTAVENAATPEAVQGASMLKKKRASSGRSISRRWLYLFGSCVRCKNPQQRERGQFAVQHSYTSVPLVETTFEGTVYRYE